MRSFIKPLALLLIALPINFAPAQQVESTAAPTGRDANSDTITLTLTPAPQPEHALRYRLMPSVFDEQPGNAALMYLTAAQSLPHEPWPDEQSEWLEMPLDELPLDKAKAALGDASDLRFVEQGARRSRIEWDATHVRTQGVAALLPQLAPFRLLQRRLALRIRVEIAEGRYDDAIASLQTGIAFAHHLERGPTLIESLVGAAMAQMMMDRVEELIQQPDAPNLYWALADLPRPLVNMRYALQHEMHIIDFAVRQVRRAESARTVLEEINTTGDFIAGLYGYAMMMGQSLGDERATKAQRFRLGATAAGIAIYHYPRAKRYLIEEKGMTADQVEAMPVSKVAFEFAMHRYRYHRDELFKWFTLPYWQAARGLEQAEQQLKHTRRTLDGFPFSMLLPAVSSAYTAQARLDRRVAVLQTIEAIRMHAATNDGRLPQSLDAITIAPPPIDPITGEAFGYQRVGDTALLTAPAPKLGREADAVRYEIRLRKK